MLSGTSSTCFVALVMLFLAADVSADVTSLSKEALAAILSEPAEPNPWLVRFHIPFDPQDAANRRAFAEASQRVPTSVGRFGEFALDSLDNLAMIDGMQVANLPTIALLGSRIGRAIGASGANKVARLTYFSPEFRLNQTNPSDIAMYLLANVPARYADRVTNTIMDSVHFVFSKKEVYSTSQKLQQLRSLGEITALPSSAVLFFLDLTNPSRKDLVAAMSSVASQAAGSVIVFATSDDDVALQFGLTAVETAASFPFPLPDDSSEKLELTIHAAASSMSDVAAVINKVADVSRVVVKDTQSRTLRSWSSNLRALQTTSPLRKLSTTDQFLRDVVEPKSCVTVLFLLRETDDFFNSHFRTAVDLASHLRQDQHSSALTKAKIANPFRFEVFWVDAEVHKSVPQVLKAKSVPSIAILFSVVAQNGQPAKAGKWFEPPKKGEWPTAAQILQFLTSEHVATNNGLFPFDPLLITFADASSSSKKSASAKASALGADAPNNMYRAVDFKTYPAAEERENTFVNQLMSGSIKHEPRKSEVDESSSSSSSSKLSAKKLAKKKKREEAEKAKLTAEIEQKKKDKEERTRRKAEEDAAKRAEMAAEAKRLAKEEKKKQKGKASTTGSDGGDDSTKSRGENTYERPKFNPTKPAKDRHQQHEYWKGAMKEAAKRFVVMSGKPAKVTVVHTLEAPVAASGAEGGGAGESSRSSRRREVKEEPVPEAREDRYQQHQERRKARQAKREAPPADDDGAISDE